MKAFLYRIKEFISPKKRINRKKFEKQGDVVTFVMDEQEIKVKLSDDHVEYDRYEDWRRLQELKGEPEWLDKIWGINKEKQQSFYEFAELEEGLKVLDVGFRDGHNLRYLQKDGIDIIGIDVNRYAIEHARQMNLNVYCEDIQAQTHFEDNSFDVILMCDVFEHLFSPKAALNECIRLLKPQGRIVFEVPLEAEFDENVLHGHASLFYSTDRFEQILNEHSLRIEKTAWYANGTLYRVVARFAEVVELAC